jgi:hypothetical protein
MMMRPYKRASLIAKSIIKMTEDGGGGSAETSRVAVLLPAPIFDSLLSDWPAQVENATALVRIRGVVFERVVSRRRKRKVSVARNSSVAKPRSA